MYLQDRQEEVGLLQGLDLHALDQAARPDDEDLLLVFSFVSMCYRDLTRHDH